MLSKVSYICIFLIIIGLLWYIVKQRVVTEGFGNIKWYGGKPGGGYGKLSFTTSGILETPEGKPTPAATVLSIPEDVAETSAYKTVPEGKSTKETISPSASSYFYKDPNSPSDSKEDFKDYPWQTFPPRWNISPIDEGPPRIEGYAFNTKWYGNLPEGGYGPVAFKSGIPTYSHPSPSVVTFTESAKSSPNTSGYEIIDMTNTSSGSLSSNPRRVTSHAPSNVASYSSRYKQNSGLRYREVTPGSQMLSTAGITTSSKFSMNPSQERFSLPKSKGFESVLSNM